MRKQIFTIYDTKAEVFSQFPFPAQNKGDAIRGFTDALSNPDSEFSKHPLDYALYRIGEYDSVLGIIDSEENPEYVIAGKDVIDTRPTQLEMGAKKEEVTK